MFQREKLGTQVLKVEVGPNTETERGDTKEVRDPVTG